MLHGKATCVMILICVESWKKKWQSNCSEEIKSKPLHGQYPAKVTEITIDEKHSNIWKMRFKNGNWSFNDSRSIPCLDNWLSLNANTWNKQDFKYRMYKETIEAVSHILNMCPKLTTINYMKRHINVAAILRRNICQHYWIKTSKTQCKHVPEPALENKEVVVLWDFEKQTTRRYQ